MSIVLETEFVSDELYWSGLEVARVVYIYIDMERL